MSNSLTHFQSGVLANMRKENNFVCVSLTMYQNANIKTSESRRGPVFCMIKGLVDAVQLSGGRRCAHLSSASLLTSLDRIDFFITDFIQCIALRRSNVYYFGNTRRLES